MLKEFERIYRNRFEEARKKDKPVVGWICTQVPEEIIYAANALPFRVLGTMEFGPEVDPYLEICVCPFVRSYISLAVRKEYDFLDGLVVGHTCDITRRSYDLWGYVTKTPFTYFINTPHTYGSEEANKFYLKEIKLFKEGLESFFGRHISDKSLRQAIEVYNKNRDLLKKTYELRREHPPLISGIEALEIVISSMSIPKDEHNKLLCQLLKEVPDREVPKGPRIFVSGSIVDHTNLIELIEECGGNVVCDDLCTGARYFWNLVEPNADPLSAIAKRYMNKIPCGFMIPPDGQYVLEDKHDFVMGMVKKYDVNGVIINTHKYCDPYMFEAPILTEKLQERDIPSLSLEHDHTRGGIEHLRTRVEAFIEMLR